MARKKKSAQDNTLSQLSEISEIGETSPPSLTIDELNPKVTSAPAKLVESGVNDAAKSHEIARLQDLWRLNGLASLKGIEDLISELFPGCSSHPNIYSPIISKDGDEVGIRDLIQAVTLHNAERGGALRHYHRLNSRRVGISIYVLVALRELSN